MHEHYYGGNIGIKPEVIPGHCIIEFLHYCVSFCEEGGIGSSYVYDSDCMTKGLFAIGHPPVYIYIYCLPIVV